MLYSMTGYGRVQFSLADKQVNIEVRSLNAKTSEVRMKLSSILKDKELFFRKLLMEKAFRGKMELSIDIQSMSENIENTLNTHIIKSYFHELQNIKADLGLEDNNLLQVVMSLPNVISRPEEELGDEMWIAIKSSLDSAIEKMMDYRSTEGANTEIDFSQRITRIKELLVEVDPHEKGRVENIKLRLTQNMDQHFGSDKVDKNRFEQELIYYLEKIDINEEKVRLDQHCDYFLEIMSNDDISKGRKLNFISQEIGREINTLGAKAYNSSIQKIVVNMKDELEKVKEQIANIL